MIPSEALATVVMMKVTKWILVVKLDFSDKEMNNRRECGTVLMSTFEEAKKMKFFCIPGPCIILFKSRANNHRQVSYK